MRFTAFTVVFAFTVLTGHLFAAEPADTREYWVYEGGWFARSKDKSWYELNEFTQRKQGKPSVFGEVKRTKDYVELYDENRKVGIRLFDTVSEVRHSDAKNAEWTMLYKGRWKNPDQ